MNKKYSKTSYLVLKNSTGYHAYMMTVIADSDYIKGDFSKLQHNSYSKRDADFSGKVIYSSPKGGYLCSYTYRNGRIILAAAASQPSAKQIQDTGSGGINVLDTSCTDWYLVYSIDDEIVSVTYLYTICVSDGSQGGGGGSAPGPSPCPTTISTAVGKVGVLEDNGPPADGLPPDGGGFPPPTDPDDPVNNLCTAPVSVTITDSVKNPCLRKMVDDILSSNVKGKVDSMIQGVFGDNQKLNLFITDQVPMTDPADVAEDLPVRDANNMLTGSSISLDANRLATSSKEYIAATIMHEALHAYLDSKGIAIGDSQHAVMAASYVDTMAKDLMTMFVGLTKDAAYSLAWAGLETTYLYSNPGNTYFPQYQKDINTLYKFHTDTVNHRVFGHGC